MAMRLREWGVIIVMAATQPFVSSYYSCVQAKRFSRYQFVERWMEKSSPAKSHRQQIGPFFHSASGSWKTKMLACLVQFFKSIHD